MIFISTQVIIGHRPNSDKMKIMLEKSVALREQKTEGCRSNEIKSKILYTQNIMKNKFEKAFANRLEREHNLNQAMEPLRALTSPTITSTTTTSINENDSPNEDESLRKLSKSKNTSSQLRLATKSYSNLAIKSRPMTTTLATKTTPTTLTKLADSDIIRNYSHNPNALCERLRLLVTSQIAGNINQIEEINIIIVQLRDLGIIV